MFIRPKVCLSVLRFMSFLHVLFLGVTSWLISREFAPVGWCCLDFGVMFFVLMGWAFFGFLVVCSGRLRLLLSVLHIFALLACVIMFACSLAVVCGMCGSGIVSLYVRGCAGGCHLLFFSCSAGQVSWGCVAFQVLGGSFLFVVLLAESLLFTMFALRFSNGLCVREVAFGLWLFAADQ